ncbi:MAG: flavin reductase family protein [Alphaproteobacteria bacterium]
MYFDPAETMRPGPLTHSPFKALVVPRPIGWISTVDSSGRSNIAPFSYFNAVSDDPPCVMFCPNGAHKDGGAKDTLANIEATGEFVHNLVGWDLKDAMNETSANRPHGESEFDFADLKTAPSNIVKAPRVAAAAASFECRHLKTVAIPSDKGDTENYIVIGQVIVIHIRDDVIKDGKIDLKAIRPVARLGYMDYTVVDEIFSMQRPD